MRRNVFSRSVKPHNQDDVGSGDQFLAVADGATPLEGGKEVERATADFSSALIANLGRCDVRPENLAHAISTSIDLARAEVNNAHAVTSTLSVVTWDDDVVRVASIGDSVALILHSRGWSEVIDPRYAGNETAVLSRVKRCVLGGMSWDKAYEQVKQDLVQSRRSRNTENGTWIVSSKTEGSKVVDRMHFAEFCRPDVKGAAAITDGALAWRDTFALIDDNGLFSADERALDALWKEANAIQRADPDRSIYPRLSDLDDASLARVDFC